MIVQILPWWHPDLICRQNTPGPTAAWAARSVCRLAVAPQNPPALPRQCLKHEVHGQPQNLPDLKVSTHWKFFDALVASKVFFLQDIPCIRPSWLNFTWPRTPPHLPCNSPHPSYHSFPSPESHHSALLRHPQVAPHSSWKLELARLRSKPAIHSFPPVRSIPHGSKCYAFFIIALGCLSLLLEKPTPIIHPSTCRIKPLWPRSPDAARLSSWPR